VATSWPVRVLAQLPGDQAGTQLKALQGQMASGLHSTLASPGTSDFLYGVRFYDPWTFAGISSFLVTVSLLASLVPAVRAVRVDPMVALRCE
jgi:hypothetical protein